MLDENGDKCRVMLDDEDVELSVVCMPGVGDDGPSSDDEELAGPLELRSGGSNVEVASDDRESVVGDSDVNRGDGYVLSLAESMLCDVKRTEEPVSDLID